MIAISKYKGNLAVTIYLRGHVYRTHAKHVSQVGVALYAWAQNPKLDFTIRDAFSVASYIDTVNLICKI